jgi:hypothetical protein
MNDPVGKAVLLAPREEDEEKNRNTPVWATPEK